MFGTKYLDEFARTIVAMNVPNFILHQSVARQKTANHKKKDMLLSFALHRFSDYSSFKLPLSGWL